MNDSFAESKYEVQIKETRALTNCNPLNVGPYEVNFSKACIMGISFMKAHCQKNNSWLVSLLLFPKKERLSYHFLFFEINK
jgi:hypothetical protein